MLHLCRQSMLLHMLIVVLLAYPSAARREPGLPANLQPGVFQPVVDRMWRTSPTFRRQCHRLAAEPNLTITLRAETPQAGSRVRAFTTIAHTQRGVVAEVVIHSLVDAVELIGHELEHVVERLDGADPLVDTCEGRARSGGGDSYETCRAVQAGRQVAREMAGTQRARVRTVRQQDASSGAFHAPSARVSADGRFLVFTSAAGLSPNARHGARELYVFDLQTDQVHLESTRPGWADSYVAHVSRRQARQFRVERRGPGPPNARSSRD
jgi:hypothetical protein